MDDLSFAEFTILIERQNVVFFPSCFRNIRYLLLNTFGVEKKLAISCCVPTGILSRLYLLWKEWSSSEPRLNWNRPYRKLTTASPYKYNAFYDTFKSWTNNWILSQHLVLLPLPIKPEAILSGPTFNNMIDKLLHALHCLVFSQPFTLFLSTDTHKLFIKYSHFRHRTHLSSLVIFGTRTVLKSYILVAKIYPVVNVKNNMSELLTWYNMFRVKIKHG